MAEDITSLPLGSEQKEFKKVFKKRGGLIVIACVALIFFVFIPFVFLAELRAGQNLEKSKKSQAVNIGLPAPTLYTTPTPTPTITSSTKVSNSWNYAELIDQCGVEQCLFKHPAEDSVEGFGKLVGYYVQTDRVDWGDAPVKCDSFVVTDGSKALIDHFREWAEGGNGINRINDKGELVVNLDIENVNSDMQQEIKASKPGDTIELSVIRWTPVGRGASVCTSFVDIISVK